MKVSKTGIVLCIIYTIFTAVCVSFSIWGTSDYKSTVVLIQLPIVFPVVLIGKFISMCPWNNLLFAVTLYIFCISINLCLLYGFGYFGDRWLGSKKFWSTIGIIAIFYYGCIKACDSYYMYLNERNVSKEEKTVSSFGTNKQKLGLLVKPGDTIDQMKSAYHIPPEPILTPNPISEFLAQEGICFFFDKTGKIYKIRLESPFQGSVKGVKIGDSSEMVIKSLGEPTRRATLTGKSSPNTFYYTHEGLELWFDSSGTVQTIFLSE